MREEGVMFTCPRCGKQEFRPYRPLKDKYDDPVETEWTRVTGNVWICPKCGEKFAALLGDFLNPCDPNDL